MFGWLRRKKAFVYDETAMAHIFSKVSILDARVSAIEIDQENIRTQIGKVRAKVNRETGFYDKNTNARTLSPEEESFYKSTIEYNELMKGQSLNTSKDSEDYA